MKVSIEGDNNGSIGALGNNLTELKKPLLSNIERMDALLLRAKSTASREAQQYEELRQMEKARVGMLEAQLQEKEEALLTKEAAISQLQENFTAKVQELEQQKEDLSGLLDKQNAEIEAKISMLEAQLQENEETLLTKEAAISQLQATVLSIL